jgi:hypothetical protein
MISLELNGRGDYLFHLTIGGRYTAGLLGNPFF